MLRPSSPCRRGATSSAASVWCPTRGVRNSPAPSRRCWQKPAALAEKGVREVTLLGQNVNAYRGADGAGTASLARLVTELSSVQGIERIRYTTSHPRDMSDDLIAAHTDNHKLMPYLHLPVQAGSNRVLKAMNRGHSAEDYLALLARVRKARPDIAISGDFIVGFPGETEAEFEETMALVRAVNYASAFSFKYSPRPGNPRRRAWRPGAGRGQACPPAPPAGPFAGEQQQAFNSSCVGRSFPVLLEKPGRQDGQMIGRSPYLQSVHMDIPQDGPGFGAIVEARILGVGPNSLSGQYVRQLA